tara:strand:- start:14601 stop:15275 length:675 start_codon:yes stop_codon:yes gene_type:complete
MIVKSIVGILLAVTVQSASGASAVIDGREWMQLTDTTNMSYLELSELCDVASGGCSGQFEGWKWATSNDVAYMFDSYMNSSVIAEGFHVPSDLYRERRLGDSGFFDDFVPSRTQDQGYRTTFSASGLTRDKLFGDDGIILAGFVQYEYIDYPENNSYFAALVFPGYSDTFKSNTLGSWLFKGSDYPTHEFYEITNPHVVPLPAAAYLFAPALLGFLGFRRKLRA